MNYAVWCNLTDEQLAQRGIAEMNLACAYGLPPTGQIDVPALCKRVDEWADIADFGIHRMWKRRARGEHAELTGNQYRIMVTVLQRNLGVKYNWAFSQGEYDATDSRNLFLHGPLTGHGGTCVSMPALYAAVGRRLGFPIKIVLAKQHSFCRWDGDGERFNIEATSPGFNSRPDEHYKSWPKPITPEEIERGWYLKSLSPTEELAHYIGQRGNCWFDHLQTQRACEAHGIAHHLVPDNDFLNNIWGLSLLFHRTIEHLRNHRAEHPNAVLVPLPEPRTEWERWAMPMVDIHLKRIHANKMARKARIAHDQAMQELTTSSQGAEPCTIQ